MAGFTLMTEILCCMIRVGCPVIIILMTAVTTCIYQLIVPIGMAILALNRCMPSGKREFGGVVIERGRAPGSH